MIARRWILLLLPLVLVGVTVSDQRALGDEKRPKTLDEALLEDLGGDPIKGLDRESSKAQPDKPQTTERPKTLESASTADDGNPAVGIARRMRDVESRIARADCGNQTQQTQRQILADLDELIKQARKSCGQCKPGDKKSCTGVQQRKPVAQPCNKPGEGQGKPGEKPSGSNKGQIGRADPKTPDTRRADVEQTKTLMKQLWGELPQRDREQMLQLPVEEFLPEYELLIEDYFRRLSEEKGAPSEPR
ncbi:MAG: hypothetical protein NTW96_12245 [Planctomycetia bacterium]|nr:hypothetical protein [Planctomycetia bacterium]